MLLGAAVGVCAHAQDRLSLDPDKALTQYLHHVWQADEGLPQNTVRAIVQTQDGYLWMGTEEGLVRFDGMRFVVFNKSNTAAFGAGHTILALVEGHAGDLWIGTGEGSVVQYTDGQFIPLGPDPQPDSQGRRPLSDRVGQAP